LFLTLETSDRDTVVQGTESHSVFFLFRANGFANRYAHNGKVKSFWRSKIDRQQANPTFSFRLIYGLTAAECPTTVTRSWWPRALTRRTQKPFSSVWYVPRRRGPPTLPE